MNNSNRRKLKVAVIGPRSLSDRPEEFRAGVEFCHRLYWSGCHVVTGGALGGDNAAILAFREMRERRPDIDNRLTVHLPKKYFNPELREGLSEMSGYECYYHHSDGDFVNTNEGYESHLADLACIHPALHRKNIQDRLSDNFTYNAMYRNSIVIAGRNLEDDPVDLVLLIGATNYQVSMDVLTRKFAIVGTKGGSDHAIQVARKLGIPVFSPNTESSREGLFERFPELLSPQVQTEID